MEHNICKSSQLNLAKATRGGLALKDLNVVTAPNSSGTFYKVDESGNLSSDEHLALHIEEAADVRKVIIDGIPGR